MIKPHNIRCTSCGNFYVREMTVERLLWIRSTFVCHYCRSNQPEQQTHNTMTTTNPTPTFKLDRSQLAGFKLVPPREKAVIVKEGGELWFRFPKSLYNISTEDKKKIVEEGVSITGCRHKVVVDGINFRITNADSDCWNNNHSKGPTCYIECSTVPRKWIGNLMMLETVKLETLTKLVRWYNRLLEETEPSMDDFIVG